MSGTREGGIKTRKALKERYGDDYYRYIGSIGGSRSKTGGFAANPKLAKEAGVKGGLTSRRSTYDKEEIERIKAIRKADHQKFLEERAAFLKKHGMIIKQKKV